VEPIVDPFMHREITHQPMQVGTSADVAARIVRDAMTGLGWFVGAIVRNPARP
jgi:hypothetical protein